MKGKIMQITFNLEQAQTYIPSGRLMNLKHRLNWDDIDLNKTDEQAIRSYINTLNFTVNTDFDKSLLSKVEGFMKQYGHEARRLDMYKSLSYKMDQYSSLDDKLPPIPALDNIINETIISMQNNEQIINKKRKLAQLKLVNSMN